MSTGNNLFIFVDENNHSYHSVCPELNSMQTDPKIQWHGLLDGTWDIISKFECNYQTLCIPLLLLSRDQAMTLCVSKPFVFCFLRTIHVYINSLSLGMCLEVVLHAHCPKHIPTIIWSETKENETKSGRQPPALYGRGKARNPSYYIIGFNPSLVSQSHHFICARNSISTSTFGV